MLLALARPRRIWGGACCCSSSLLLLLQLLLAGVLPEALDCLLPDLQLGVACPQDADVPGWVVVLVLVVLVVVEGDARPGFDAVWTLCKALER